MDLDLDTFLVTVYCTIDELYTTHYGPHTPLRPGATPEMSDPEVLTVMVVGQWQQERSERRFVRYVGKHWQHYFPRMLSQSAFNRRARDLMPVLSALGPVIGQQVTQDWRGVAYEVVDGVPVPLMRRCRGLQRRLFAGDEAGLGKGGSDKTWYYGVHLVGAVHPSGVITGFTVGPADTAERWLLDTLLRWRRAPTAPQPTPAELLPVLGPRHCKGGQRLGPTGLLRGRTSAGAPASGPYVADLGFRGKYWQAHWHTHYGATLLTKADLPQEATQVQQRALRHTACSVRQVVETTFGYLTEHLGLVFPRARTLPGLLARLGAKVAAFNLALLLNTTFGRPSFASCSPFDL